MKIAVVHDWFPAYRGGERVVAEICKVFPQADIFTLFDFLSDEEKRAHFPGIKFTSSPANRLPKVEKYYKNLFALCPLLIEQFDLTEYDAVISSSAAFSRGVITRPDQPHLSYVHSPIRYIWDQQFEYMEQGKLGFGPKGLLFRWLAHRMRIWDTRTAHGPDRTLANSSYVAARVRRVYGREATVVYPPVDVDEMTLVEAKDDYYVVASYLVPYKRVDLVVRAFNDMPDKRLVVVGSGQELAKLKALAGPNISFKGFVPRAELVSTIANAKAFIFAGCEDFGIVMAEAQACGTPLIAFGRGGARDIVRNLGETDEPTGLLFKEQTEKSVKDAVARFEAVATEITPSACRKNALRFNTSAFQASILKEFQELTSTFA
jgi:glycosyltransferase involved in cell wall biosynthesis